MAQKNDKQIIDNHATGRQKANNDTGRAVVTERAMAFERAVANAVI